MLERIALGIYLGVLTLGPLLFGGVHTYAYSILYMGVLVGGALLVWTNVKKEIKTGSYRFHSLSTSLHFLCLIILAYLAFQLLPLPPSIVRSLSPETWVVHQKSLPASLGTVFGSQFRDWLSLSPYAHPVRMSIVRWSVYGLFFLGMTQMMNSMKRLELACFLILIVGSFEALYGLLQTYSGHEHIWWYEKEVGRREVTGTYINRNHFAGFMEICLILSPAFAVAVSERRKKRINSPGLRGSLRARLVQFLSGEQRLNKRLFILFAGVVIGIGLIFSASRGGMVSSAGGLLCLGLLFLLRRGFRRKGLVVLFLFAVIAAYAFRIGIDHPLARFETLDTGLEGRARLTQRAMDLFRDYKIAGVGIGNFQYAFPRYYPPEGSEASKRHAHNDWIQFLAEAGIIGFCLMLVGVSYTFYLFLKLWIKRKDPVAVSLGAASMGAMTAIGIHSYFDFNLHFPGTFLALAAVIAVGYSALHLERRHHRETSIFVYRVIPMKYKGIVLLLMFLGFLVWNGTWTLRHFIGEAYCNTVQNSTLNRDQRPNLSEIQRAIAWDTGNASYWYKKALKLMSVRSDEETLLFADKAHSLQETQAVQQEIIRSLEQAVRLNPFSSEYHLWLGWEYCGRWKESDYVEKWLPAADESMNRAAYFVGKKDPLIHVSIGNYWVIRSKTMTPADPRWEPAWTKACWHFRRAQELAASDSLRNKIVEFVWRFYPDREMIQQVMLVKRS